MDEGGNPQVTTGADYTGHGHVGGDEPGGLDGRPGRPSALSFDGQIDEAAVHPRVLTPAQVARHHQLGTQGVPR